jgi:hypothetical protein
MIGAEAMRLARYSPLWGAARTGEQGIVSAIAAC